MFETIIYLNPVYVTLFWAVILNLNRRRNTSAKSVLGKFMIFAFIVYFSHFIFYYPFVDFYAFIDPLYQFSSLIVYPIYYIYVRLLTVDERYSIRKHGRYFLIPLTLSLLYLVGVLFSDFHDYKHWLYHRNDTDGSLKISFLKPVYLIIRITFVVQLFYLMYASVKKLNKYKDQAEQYYSNYEDGRNINVLMINISMFLAGIGSIVIAVLGRDFFIDKPYLLVFPSIVFSISLFVIGYLGILQKPVNPTFEIVTNETSLTENGMKENQFNTDLHLKILDLFENQKIYLNNELNIIHLANITGSNRTYISQLINHHYQQNFCTFVNSYRIRDVKGLIKMNPDCTNQLIADACGFSSTDSLKRVVKSQTGMSVTELKNVIINQNE